jgi:hypothetical protein
MRKSTPTSKAGRRPLSSDGKRRTERVVCLFTEDEHAAIVERCEIEAGPGRRALAPKVLVRAALSAYGVAVEID